MARPRLSRAVFATTAFRLTALTVALFVAAAAAILALMFWQTNRVLTDQVLQTLSAEVSALREAERDGGLAALRIAVERRSAAVGPGIYFLSNASGQRLAGNLEAVPASLRGSERGGVFVYTLSRSGVRTSIDRASETPAQTTAEPRDAGQSAPRLGVAIPARIAGATVLVGRDIEDQRALAARIRWISLLGFGGLALAGLLGGLATSWFLLRRVDSINSASGAIMAGDLSQRLPVAGTGDELDTLAGGVNRMLARIEQLMYGLRDVSENIAHDLKTPLNRLRNSAEAALRNPDVGAQRAGLEHVIAHADDLIQTFNALLLIAKLEAGAVDDTLALTQLADIVRDVGELYEPVAEDADFALSIEIAASPIANVNRQLIMQAVANLLDNAIKYAAAPRQDGTAAVPKPSGHNRDRSITLTLSQHRQVAGDALHTVPHDVAVISVADHGPGIALEDRDRVLDRFVRLDKSRTKPGTGLGLSLVAAVARIHGGRITFGDNAPGLVATLELPLRAPPARAAAANAIPAI